MDRTKGRVSRQDSLHQSIRAGARHPPLAIETKYALWRRQENRRGYHHLGFGKPLGMGTVRVNAISCCLVSGSTLAQQYISLNGVNGHFSEIALENGQTEKIKNINIQGHIDDHLPTKFTASLPVKCFRRQACGWQDGLPVCYPTEQPKSAASSSTSDNPTLTWFRKREDNRVKLASLYDHANAERKQIEDAESQFGPYSFPTLDE